MARPIVLSNGSMLVGLNRFGEVHDFFYPYVGLENHDTARDLRHRIGVYVDNKLTWIDDNDWEISQDYLTDTLIGKTIARNSIINIELEFTDAVDHDHDVLMRHVAVKNLLDSEREVQLVFHQVFNISNTLSGDTAQYIPQEQAILHYSGYRNFVVKASSDYSNTFNQFSVGLCGIEGKLGTYVDAEDGKLEGNPVEHGSVDSTISCHLKLGSGGSPSVFYSVAAGNTREAALLTSQIADGEKMFARIKSTERSWKYWIRKANPIADELPKYRAEKFKKSLLLIKAHIDRRGSVIASSDTAMLNYARDAYTYCWPRDAVNALLPLLRLGYTKEVIQFFEFCSISIQHSGYLMHKYRPDGAVGSSWHPYTHNGRDELPIQEDETAAVLFLINEYYKTTKDSSVVKRFYSSLIKPMAEFMAHYIDEHTGLPHASYDLWEEQFGTSTYTVAITQAAMDAAADLAGVIEFKDDEERWRQSSRNIRSAAKKLLYNNEAKYFYKMVYSNPKTGQDYNTTIDGSALFGAWAFGLYSHDDQKVSESVQSMLNAFNLQSDFTGLPRYVKDAYNSSDPESLGNPWFITSLWLAQYYIEIGNARKAENIIKWTEKHMTSSGVLPEQFDPAHPDRPVSVAPLVWSQAEYVMTIISLSLINEGERGEDLLRSRHVSKAGHPQEIKVNVIN